MVPHLVVAAVVLMIATSCGSDAPGAAALYGGAVPVGDGTARPYVTMAGETPRDDVHLLPMPAGARSAGVVTHRVSVEWNPHAHEPDGLLTAPHVYTGSPAERMTWMPTPPDFANEGHEPAAVDVPADHIADPTGVVIPTYAPDGPAFTEGFLEGSYEAEAVLEAPMMTGAYVESLRSSGAVHEGALTQPAAAVTAEYYPTPPPVGYDAEAGAPRVGLVRRAAS